MVGCAVSHPPTACRLRIAVGNRACFRHGCGGRPRPNASDQAALAQQIASVVQGLKSCTFDLSDVSVNVDRLSEASVAIQGVTVPLSTTDGWRMNTPTQLELVGSACTTWNLPANTKIDFNFPCDIIIPK